MNYFPPSVLLFYPQKKTAGFVFLDKFFFSYRMEGGGGLDIMQFLTGGMGKTETVLGSPIKRGLELLLPEKGNYFEELIM